MEKLQRQLRLIVAVGYVLRVQIVFDDSKQSKLDRLQTLDCTHGDHELHRRSTIGMCLMETRFVCAVGILLCYGSSSSFFLSTGFPSFFFLLFWVFFFSGFVVLCAAYIEIKCKRLEIYVAKIYLNQQVGSEFLKLEFNMELEFLKLDILVSKYISYPS